MGLFGGGPDKVIGKGQATTGTIVAIKVETKSDNDSTIRQDTYVLMIAGRRLAVRQHLRPDDRVRLGMTVQAWVRDDDVVIDWAATMQSQGVDADNDLTRWKSVKDWGGTGIEDTTVDYAKAAKRGSPARLRIEAIERKSQLGGILRTTTVRGSVTIGTDEPYEVEIGRQNFPHYATHLVEVGEEVPALVDDKRLDRVTIDWPSAAEREPGIGVAPSPNAAGATDNQVFDMMSAGSDAAASSASAAPVEAPPPPIDGVSWDAYLEVTTRGFREKLSVTEQDALAQTFGAAPGAWLKISHAVGQGNGAQCRAAAGLRGGHAVTDAAAPRTKRVVRTERRDRPFRIGLWLAGVGVACSLSACCSSPS